MMRSSQPLAGRAVATTPHSSFTRAGARTMRVNALPIMRYGVGPTVRLQSHH